MSKAIKHSKQYEHVKHDFILKKIKDYLLEQKNGASPDEIWNFLGKKIVRSRATIHNSLAKLIEQDDVFVKNHRYFIKDLDLLGRNWCGKILNDAAKIVLNPELATSDTEQTNLRHHVNGTSISEYFCKTTFQKSDQYEKFFFKFANRMGAYILYIFLESLRTSEADNFRQDNVKQTERKLSLSAQLVKRSVDVSMFYDVFRNMLKDLEFARMLQINAKKKLPNSPREPVARKFANSEFVEMNGSDFERVCERFRGIYPRIYEGLEKYWDDQTALVGFDLDTLETMFGKRSQCNHKWKEIKIYKKENKYYECLNCREIANEYVKKRLDERKRQQAM